MVMKIYFYWKYLLINLKICKTKLTDFNEEIFNFDRFGINFSVKSKLLIYGLITVITFKKMPMENI